MPVFRSARRGEVDVDVLRPGRRPHTDDGAMADHGDGPRPRARGLLDHGVEARQDLHPVLAARHAALGVARGPRQGRGQVRLDGLVVPAHLQVARGQLPDALPHADLKAGPGGQRRRSELGADQGGRVEGADLLPCQRLRKCGCLLLPQRGQRRAWFGGVEQTLEVGRGLTVANEQKRMRMSLSPRKPVADFHSGTAGPLLRGPAG